MYVTGNVTEMYVSGRRKTEIRGIARITGLWVGQDIPFDVTVGSGPTGATLSLTVESLPDVVFREIVIDGNIQITK